MKIRDISTRFNILSSMNTIVKNLNNEEGYMKWIYTIPDQATKEELWDCAEDDEIFKEAVESFKEIAAVYLKDGIYLWYEKKLY